MAKSGYIVRRSNYVKAKEHKLLNDSKIYYRDYMTINNSNNTSDAFPYGESNFRLAVPTSTPETKDHGFGEWLTHCDGVDDSVCSETWTLSDVSSITESTESSIKLKPDYSDIKSFVYYGSCYELIKNAITNIINIFPGELYVSNRSYKDLYGANFDDPNYGEEMGIDPVVVLNPFNLDIVSPKIPEKENYDVSDTEKLTRYFCQSYDKYNLIRDDDDESSVNSEIINPIYWSVTSNERNCPRKNGLVSTIFISGCYDPKKMDGGSDVPFIIYEYYINGEYILLCDSSFSGTHIRPKQKYLDEFFNNLTGVETMLLNRTSNPIYTMKINCPQETDTGMILMPTYFTWPTTNDWNLDISSNNYVSYINSLLDVAQIYDEYYTNNLWKNMVHDSIKNMDLTFVNNVDAADNTDFKLGLSKIEKLMYSYGAFFDDLKRYIDNIKNVNNITYNEYNNIPDYFLTDVCTLSGWETYSTISSLRSDARTEELYSNSSYSYNVNEANTAFLRNLKINSKYILTRKGTKDGIEMLLGLFGLTSYDFARAQYNNLQTIQKEFKTVDSLAIEEYIAKYGNIEDKTTYNNIIDNNNVVSEIDEFGSTITVIPICDPVADFVTTSYKELVRKTAGQTFLCNVLGSNANGYLYIKNPDNVIDDDSFNNALTPMEVGSIYMVNAITYDGTIHYAYVSNNVSVMNDNITNKANGVKVLNTGLYYYGFNSKIICHCDYSMLTNDNDETISVNDIWYKPDNTTNKCNDVSEKTYFKLVDEETVEIVEPIYNFDDLPDDSKHDYYDYSLDEYVCVATPKNYSDISDYTYLADALADVEIFNSFKDTYTTDGETYAGLPIAPVYYQEEDESGNTIDKKYFIPWFENGNDYDGGIYFQMKGGWGKQNKRFITSKLSDLTEIFGNLYDETSKYLRIVGRVSDLVTMEYDSCFNNMIVKVTNEDDMITAIEDTFDVTDDDLSDISGYTSNYFILLDKDNKNMYGENDEWSGWVNIPSDDIEYGRYYGVNVLYVESLVDTNKGNAPHIGYANYDDGKEYLEYFAQLFKYSIENDNFNDNAYKCNDGTLLPEIEREGYGNLIDESGDTNYIKDNMKCWYFIDNERQKSIAEKEEDGDESGLYMLRNANMYYDDINRCASVKPLIKIIDRYSDDSRDIDCNIGISSYGNLYDSDLRTFDFLNPSVYDENTEYCSNSESAANSIINTKKMVITFNIPLNERYTTEYRTYIEKCILPYLKQMIPSGTIFEIKMPDDLASTDSTVIMSDAAAYTDNTNILIEKYIDDNDKCN